MSAIRRATLFNLGLDIDAERNLNLQIRYPIIQPGDCGAFRMNMLTVPASPIGLAYLRKYEAIKSSKQLTTATDRLFCRRPCLHAPLWF
jgi:hypothetical protein